MCARASLARRWGLGGVSALHGRAWVARVAGAAVVVGAGTAALPCGLLLPVELADVDALPRGPIVLYASRFLARAAPRSRAVVGEAACAAAAARCEGAGLLPLAPVVIDWGFPDG